MKRIVGLGLLLGAMFSIMFNPITTNADSAADSDKKYNIDISLSPKDVLFDINNMKPGDWAPREITIKNKGKLDFDYQMQIKNEGDEKLYNELLLEIKEADETLYSGKLADFEQIPPRFLEVNDSETLQLTIRFPEHLGNEFQGLGVNFLLQFVAERSKGPTTPEDPEDPEETTDPKEDDDQPGGVKDDSDKGGNKKDVESVGGVVNSGGKLPDTATSMFTFMVIGINLLLIGGLIWMVSVIRKSKIRRA